VPVIPCNSVFEWGDRAIAHMRSAHRPGEPPCQIEWPGYTPEFTAAALVCPTCNAWFTIRHEALKDTTDPNTRIVSDFLRNNWGREQLLRVLNQRGREGLKKGEHPFDLDKEPDYEGPRTSAWAKILEDDAFEDDAFDD